MRKNLYFITLSLFIAAGCTGKDFVKKVVTIGGTTSGEATATVNPVNTGPGSGSSDTSTCGKTTGNSAVDNYCFVTVSPTVVLHGLASQAPSNGSWTSAGTIETPESYFETDKKFNLRIVPKPASEGSMTNGNLVSRKCNLPTSNNYSRYMYSKIQVKVEVKKQGSTAAGSIQTLDATLGTSTTLVPSASKAFTTTGPGVYDIIIRDVKTNHRCTMATNDVNCSLFADFPYVTNTTYSTDCVAFEVQFATDYTRDLP